MASLSHTVAHATAHGATRTARGAARGSARVAARGAPGGASAAARACTVLLAGALVLLPPPARAEQTNAPAAPATAITVTDFATGLEHPWGLQQLPDGRLLVTERPGRLRVIASDGKLGPPVSGVPTVVSGGQAGLLDVLLAPDFGSTGTIYLSYSEPRSTFTNGTSVARAKLTLGANGAGALSDLKVIFRQEPTSTNRYHFGSRLVWARDGTLFITTGERANQSDSAQDLGTHLGKVIRINADGTVPKDNPFVGKPGAQPEIWSYGHRNLQGAALHPETGALWVTEHGAKGGDELNIAEPGKNYGWPVITWGIDYSGAKIGEGTTKAGLEQPVYYWNPSIGTSGLAFYTGSLFPGWKGSVLAGGLSGAVLERLILDGNRVVGVEHILTERGDRIRDVRMASDGAVLVLVDERKGKVLKLTPKN